MREWTKGVERERREGSLCKFTLGRNFMLTKSVQKVLVKVGDKVCKERVLCLCTVTL